MNFVFHPDDDREKRREKKHKKHDRESEERKKKKKDKKKKKSKEEKDSWQVENVDLATWSFLVSVEDCFRDYYCRTSSSENIPPKDWDFSWMNEFTQDSAFQL